MAGARQPIDLIIANGRKHLTKAEIEARKRAEVQPCADGIVAPSFLSATQKKEFARIAGQLEKLGIMGETDCDTLARYVAAEDLYEAATKKLRAAMRSYADPYELDQLAKLQDRFFKQAQTAASALGLTISSRCKLVVPKTAEEPKKNKFAAFGAEPPAGKGADPVWPVS